MKALWLFLAAGALVALALAGCAMRTHDTRMAEAQRIPGTNRPIPRNRVDAGKHTVSRSMVVGRHGGALIDLGSDYAEVKTAGDGLTTLYLYGPDGEPLETSGRTASLTFSTNGAGNADVVLAPMGTGDDARFEGALSGVDRERLAEAGPYTVDLTVVDGGSSIAGTFKNRTALVDASTVVAVGKDVPLSGNVPTGKPVYLSGK